MGDPKSIVEMLLEAEKAGREASTKFQLDRGKAKYSRAPLNLLRKAVGILESLEEEAFDLIDEFVVSEHQYEYELAVAEEASRLNPAKSLLKQVGGYDYELSAKCTLDGKKCEPDIKDVVGELKGISFDTVDMLVEMKTEREEYEEEYEEEEEEEERVSYGEWWGRMLERADELLDKLSKAGETEGVSYETAIEVAKASDKLKGALETLCNSLSLRERGLTSVAVASCVLAGLARAVGGTATVGGTLRIFLNPKIKIEDRHIRAFKVASEALGRKMGFMIPYSKPGDELSASAVLNDLANFVHIVAEEVMRRKIEVGGERTIGRCTILSGSDDILVTLCEAWDKAVSLFSREYIEADADALHGTVRDKVAQIRLGNARGHASEIEKIDDEARVKYYDADSDVRTVMKALFEKIANCDCKDVPEACVLECTCSLKSKEDAIKIASVLSRATTMDIRIENLRGYEWEVKEEEEVIKEAIKREMEGAKRAIEALKQVLNI